MPFRVLIFGSPSFRDYTKLRSILDIALSKRLPDVVLSALVASYGRSIGNMSWSPFNFPTRYLLTENTLAQSFFMSTITHPRLGAAARASTNLPLLFGFAS
jgi:hypothetical protein